MLYAQVTQIDGDSQRNVLLTHSVMTPQIPESPSAGVFIASTPQTRDVIGFTVFPEKQVEAILNELRLSRL